MSWSEAEWLDGPRFVEWLEQERCRDLRSFVIGENLVKRVSTWRQGSNASVWVADKLLVICDISLAEVPDHLFVTPPPTVPPKPKPKLAPAPPRPRRSCPKCGFLYKALEGTFQNITFAQCPGCRAKRIKLIQRRWKQGRLLKEIAAEIGCSVHRLGGEMYALRKEGVDLPYRLERSDRFPEAA